MKFGKRKNDLTSVFDETVIENVLDEIKENTKFARGEKYVLFLLDTTKIDGFTGKKNKNDEAKGSIIEQINSGSMKTVITQQMLKDNEIAFIPDSQTIELMSEYGILTKEDTPYNICFIDEDGEITKTQKSVKFATIVAIDNGEKTIETVLNGEEEDKKVGIDQTDTTVDNMPEDDMPEDDLNQTQLMNVANGKENENLYGGEQHETESDETTPQDEPLPETQEEEVADNEQEHEEEEDEVVIDKQDVDKAIEYRFFSDDLGIQFTDKPFEAMFKDKYCPLLSCDRPSSWINDKLNKFAQDTNEYLKSKHDSNYKDIKNEYFIALSTSVAKIRADLDGKNENSKFYEPIKQCEEEKENKLDGINEVVALQKQSLEQQWDDKLDEYKRNVVIEAENKYKQMYEAEYTEKISNLKNDIQLEIENNYNVKMREINDQRRSEASRLMDDSITKIMGDLGEKYNKKYQEEINDQKAALDELKIMVDKYIKDETLRNNVKRQEIERDSRIKRIAEESKLQLEGQLAQYKADIERAKQVHKQEKEEILAQLDQMKLAKENQKILDDDEKTRLNARIDQLMEQYANVENKKEDEYKVRIDLLKNEVLKADDRYEQLAKSSRRSSVLLGAITVISVVAFAAIGFIIGVNIHNMSDTDDSTQKIIQEFKDQIQQHDQDTDSSDNTKQDDNKSDKMMDQ